jgi:hypothetical protein
MGNDSRTLEILLKVKDEATAGLAKVNAKIEDLQPAFKKMAVAGTVAFTAISAVAVTSFKAFADAEAQTVISTKSLENTLSGMTKKQLETQWGFSKASDVLQNELIPAMNDAGKSAIKLGFDDEEASNSFAKLFAVTKDSAQAMKELTVAQDLARYKGISLEDATQKLMLVHAGATKELKTLGLAVNEDATAMQNMDAITKQVTGSADAFAKTSAGAMEIMKVSSDNLKESIGQALQPAFQKLAETLVPLVQKFVDWAEKNPELISKLILVGGAVAGVVAVVGTLGVMLPAIIAGFTLLTGTLGIVIGIIAGLGFAIYKIIGIYKILKEDSDLVWEGMKIMAKETVDSIVGWFTSAWDKIKKIVDSIKGAVNVVKDKASSIGTSIVNKAKSVIGINDGVIAPNGQLVSTAPDDWLIATKNPASLGAGAGGITINLNGTFMSPKETMKEITDEIAGELKRRLRI